MMELGWTMPRRVSWIPLSGSNVSLYNGSRYTLESWEYVFERQL